MVSEKLVETNESEDKQRSFFARFGEGRWYAILPNMEVGLRRAGAEVYVTPVSDAEECTRGSGIEVVTQPNPTS